MAELGLLTPEELFQALNSNRLPNREESMESQKQYLNERNDGLYFPLVGGSPTENPAMESWEASEPKNIVNPNKETQKSQTTSPNNGRPAGSDAPKQMAAKQKYSFEEVRANIVKSQNLEKKVEKESSTLLSGESRK